MNVIELSKIQEKAKENQATISDVVEIVASSFISASKHFSEIKQTLKSILETLQSLESRVEIVERQTISPIYQNVIDDEDDEAYEQIDNENSLEEDQE